VFEQDRWSDHGARGVAAVRSLDGGVTFTEGAIPLTRCAPGGLPFERADSADASIGPDGVTYAIAATFNVSTSGSAAGVAVSTDTGLTWQHTAALGPQADATHAVVNPSITADPARPGTAYAVWNINHTNASGLTDADPAVLAITHDAGRTWSAPRQVARTGTFQQIVDPHVLGDPHSGTVYLFYTLMQWPDDSHTDPNIVLASHLMLRSTDGGSTWSHPIVVAPDSSAGSYNPSTGAAVANRAVGLASAAIDAQTGQLYVVFAGKEFTPFNSVELVTSTDHGTTWSAPDLVTRGETFQATQPSVAVNPATGQVAISYYDQRTLTPQDITTLPTTAWITMSLRGGHAFDRELPVAPAFDLPAATPGSEVSGADVGTHQGLVATAEGFRPMLTTYTTGGGTSVYTVGFTLM
jgi:hypothetical protein